MAIRLEKSGELMMIYGTTDEPDPQEEWSQKRRKLGVLLFAVAVVALAMYLVPQMPGHVMINHVIKAVLAVIW